MIENKRILGATTQYGPEAARRTVLFGMLFGSPSMANADTHGGMEGRFIQGVLPTPPRVELDGDHVAHLRNYFFNPDFIAEVCGELGLPWRSNGHRWSTMACAGAPNPAALLTR